MSAFGLHLHRSVARAGVIVAAVGLVVAWGVSEYLELPQHWPTRLLD